MSSDVIDKKQKLLLEYLIAEKEVFVKTYHIVKPEYFEPPLDKVVAFILDYFKKHMDTPNVDTIEAETEILLKERELDRDEHSYLLEEIETFCQNEAMSLAILESVDYINDGNLKAVQPLVRDALMVRLDTSIGRSLYDSVDDRINNDAVAVEEYSTGIEEFDEMIGKLRKGEFGMVYAVTSGGKSLMLANIAHALSLQKLNVVIISLELKEDLYCRRLDALITNTDIKEHRNNGEFIAKHYAENYDDMGAIVVKKMKAGSTASEIEAYLMDYTMTTDTTPDVIIVDYLQLMSVEGVKSNNKFDQDHEKAIGLIRMSEEFDAIMLSAGQINREGYDIVKPTPAHCAGGLSVINDSDWAVAMVGTEEDIENNQIQVAPLKIRHAKRVTQNLTLYRNPQSLRITAKPTECGSTGVKKKATSGTAQTNGKNKLRKALTRM